MGRKSSDIRQAPVDGGRPVREQGLIHPAKRPRAKETSRRGQGARMCRHDGGDVPEQRCQRLRIAAPQDRDQRSSAPDEGTDRGLCHLFPSMAAMAARRSRSDGEHPVEQQDTLRRPWRQIAASRDLHSHIVAKLHEDVRKAARERSDIRGDGEGESDRVARSGIGILTDDEHAHLGHRFLERAKHIGTTREVSATGSVLSAQEVVERREGVDMIRQRISPVDGHDRVEVVRGYGHNTWRAASSSMGMAARNDGWRSRSGT